MKEISISSAPGLTFYAILRNASGQIWRTDSHVFETPNSSNWSSYALAMPTGVGGSYSTDFPSGVSAGLYHPAVYLQGGTSPAYYDIPADDLPVVNWTGTAVFSDYATGTAVAALPTVQEIVEGVEEILPAPATGSGPYSVTIDAGTPGAAVSLSQGIDTVKGITGNDGRILLQPAALGSYALVVTKAGYTPISRQETLTDGMTIDAELQSVVIPQPVDPNLASVVFRAIDFGAAKEGIKVTFKPVAKGAFAIEGAYETDHQITVTTDEDGQATVELYPASVLTANSIDPPYYVMESAQCGNLRRIIEVPDDGGLAIDMIVTE